MNDKPDKAWPERSFCMDIKKTSACYFSPNGTTQTVAQTIAQRLSGQAAAYDLLRHPLEKEVRFAEDELLLVAMPVYAGRIPTLCRDMLCKLKGSGTPAVALVVYGNRDYDDALLELADLLAANGFSVIAAGAFIAQHSIFPKCGANRPDKTDREIMFAFAEKCSGLLADFPFTCSIDVKGNPQYKTPGKVPLKPASGSKCTGCMACAEICPTKSIPLKDPRITNRETCISCGACIHCCPVHARSFSGPMYKIAELDFCKKNAAYKTPELFYCK